MCFTQVFCWTVVMWSSFFTLQVKMSDWLRYRPFPTISLPRNNYTLRTGLRYIDFGLKNSSFRLPYQCPSSSADCARELFKGSNGSASLVDCTRKTVFVFFFSRKKKSVAYQNSFVYFVARVSYWACNFHFTHLPTTDPIFVEFSHFLSCIKHCVCL